MIRHGNSLAIVIDKPVLDLLQITADTKIELTTNGDSIMLTPVRDTG
ncbi:MAG UNVERIFIED_CONTAM: AbrB/MazE/SpoVT family DNA-binding domain-containing protein [Planctomycetaceae bacterium]